MIGNGVSGGVIGRSFTSASSSFETADPPRMEIRGLSKSFGASRALIDVALSVAPGEIHALIGENGCGKSTLVKILSGYHAPDPGGTLLIDGEQVELPVRPATMRRCGLSVVHQDLGLLDDFSVTENIRLGQFGARKLTRAIAWRRERELASASLTALGASIDPSAKVGSLTAFERSEVAIARALQHRLPRRGLVMFDESTRALPPQPREHFYALTREVASDGGAVLLVSHQLDEVLKHADRVSVMRDGRVLVAAAPVYDLSEHDLIALMLGKEQALRSRRRARREAAAVPIPPSPPSEAGVPGTAATVEDLHGRVLRGVGFTVAKGEVLGVTGLLGSGFEELLYLLAGAQRAQRGTLRLDGEEHDLKAGSLRDLLEAGVAFVPERRGEDGLALSRSVLENVTLPRVSRRGSSLRIGSAWQRQEAEWVVRTLSVRPADISIEVGNLSGGNQQKVLLGKWLCARPKLLLLHEPTQGVDVGARADIEAALVEAAQRGCSVILAGMDVSELASVCDRILVFRDGAIEQELTGEQTTEQIVRAIYGGRLKVAL